MGENVIKAFSELNCLLDCFPESYIEKLPSELLKLIKNNCSSKYLIKVDLEKSIDDQNVTEETKNMLVVLKYNYWSNEDEQRQIKEKLQYNEEIYLNEQREKYNPDNIFINRKKEENIDSEATKALIEYKKRNVMQKIFEKIKKILKL